MVLNIFQLLVDYSCDVLLKDPVRLSVLPLMVCPDSTSKIHTKSFVMADHKMWLRPWTTSAVLAADHVAFMTTTVIVSDDIPRTDVSLSIGGRTSQEKESATDELMLQVLKYLTFR